jgi:hypothetical protein
VLWLSRPSEIKKPDEKKKEKKNGFWVEDL